VKAQAQRRKQEPEASSTGGEGRREQVEEQEETSVLTTENGFDLTTHKDLIYGKRIKPRIGVQVRYLITSTAPFLFTNTKERTNFLPQKAEMEPNLMEAEEEEARAELSHGEKDKQQEKNQQIKQDRKVQDRGAIVHQNLRNKARRRGQKKI
jgi:hypothetical protein